MMAHPAIEFLQNLDRSPDASFNIEHYTDLPKGKTKPKPDPLAGRYANLSIFEVKALLPKLYEVNKKGAGIFVARNQCTGHRNELNVSRARGVHADMDDVTEDQITVLAAVLAPSIVVRSRETGHYQLYWQLAEGEALDKTEAKAINQSLVKYGADKAAVDVSRLLRLPGFEHMKYRAEGRTPTVTASFTGVTHTAKKIRLAFPPLKTANINGSKSQKVMGQKIGTPELMEIQCAVAQRVADKYPQLWAGDFVDAIRKSGEIGYPSQSEADLALTGHIARACLKKGLQGKLLQRAIEDVFSSSALGQSQKWQTRADYRQRTIQTALASLNVTPVSQSGATNSLESHGDIKNARFCAKSFEGRFLYVTTRGRWLMWKEEKLVLCEREENVAAAKDVCGAILEAAGNKFRNDPRLGKRMVQDALMAHNLPRIIAMLKLVVSEPGMATTDKELDSDPYLLGVTNGVIDLRTGQYLVNQPEMKITRFCNASFDIDASCPRFISFLNEVFAQDTSTVECVQRLLGCTLLGLSSEEKLIICYGSGSNGKSVFSNIVHKIMGGYATTAPPSMLTTRRQGDAGPRNDLAAMAGARYVSINELQAGDRLDEQVVKMLAGREPISARFLHKEYFEYTPTFTPWLRTNHKPIIQGVEEGIWRRLVLLKFGVHFDEDQQDPLLEEKLFAERDGILMWMIEGARKYLRDGICMSQSMRNALKSYRLDSDLLGEFLTDTTWNSNHENDRVEQKSFYLGYRSWCSVNGTQHMSKKSFTQSLVERGYRETKSKGMRFYSGLKLTNEAFFAQAEGREGREGRINGNLDFSPF